MRNITAAWLRHERLKLQGPSTPRAAQCACHQSKMGTPNTTKDILFLPPCTLVLQPAAVIPHQTPLPKLLFFSCKNIKEPIRLFHHSWHDWLRNPNEKMSSRTTCWGHPIVRRLQYLLNADFSVRPKELRLLIDQGHCNLSRFQTVFPPITKVIVILRLLYFSKYNQRHSIVKTPTTFFRSNLVSNRTSQTFPPILTWMVAEWKWK